MRKPFSYFLCMCHFLFCNVLNFFQMRLLELQGKLEMAEKVADELKKQLSIEKTELSRHRELMAESTRALASKQENIDELKLEILLLSSKLSSYQKSYEELQTTLEEVSKSQEISEKTVVILKNQLVDDDQKMAVLTAQNAQLNGQIQTLSEEKRLALENLHEKVSPIYLQGGIQ